MTSRSLMQSLRGFIAEIDILLDTNYITVYQCSMVKTDISNYIYNVYQDPALSTAIKTKLKKLYEMTEAEVPSIKKKRWFFKGIAMSEYEQTKMYKKSLFELRDEISSLLFFMEQNPANAQYSYK